MLAIKRIKIPEIVTMTFMTKMFCPIRSFYDAKEMIITDPRGKYRWNFFLGGLAHWSGGE